MGYRAGTDTGSLFNYLMSGKSGVVPEVGMGATILCWTDRHAATIVEVKGTLKRPIIGVQRDIATRTDGNGMSDSQSYDYVPDTNAKVEYFTLRKDGTWVRDGETLKGGQRIALGYRKAYHDFSF